MAVDKLVDSTQLDADLTSVANAIRTKGGTSASLAFPADFVSAIAAISGGGGLPGKLVSYETVTPASDSTKTNPIQVQLQAISSYALVVAADTLPSPDTVKYWALVWGRAFVSGGSGNQNATSAILRPNGTLGTDRDMVSYSASTGIVKLGTADYGVFKAGVKYHIYLIDVSGS